MSIISVALDERTSSVMLLSVHPAKDPSEEENVLDVACMYLFQNAPYSLADCRKAFIRQVIPI